MKRKICLIMLTITLLVSASLFNAVNARSGTVSMTIDEVVKAAVENSMQSKIDKLEISIREAELKDAVGKSNVYGEEKTFLEALNGDISRIIKPLEAKLNLETAKVALEENQQKLALDTFIKAMDIVTLSKKLETEKEKYKILEKKLEIAREKKKNGLITSYDLDEAEYALASKEREITRLRSDYEIMMKDLKVLMNIEPMDLDISIKPDFTIKSLTRFNIESLVKEAAYNSSQVALKKQDIAIKEKTMELVKKYMFVKGDYMYDKAEIELGLSELDLEEIKTGIEIDVRNKYDKVLNQQSLMQIALKSYNVALSGFSIAQVKYDNGVISKEEYLAEKEKYLDAGYQKYAAIHDYNIAKAEFEYLIGE
jgi:outer membrane protein TolC